MTTEMSICDFLTQKGIKWFPIKLTMIPKVNKDRTPVLQYGEPKIEKILEPIDHITYNNARPKSNDFKYLTEQQILARQNLVKNGNNRHTFNAIAIDTRKVYHIDFDIPIEEVRKLAEGRDDIKQELDYINGLYGHMEDNNMTYYKSATKSYGFHIMFPPVLSDDIKNKHPFKNLTNDVEILAGGWSWCPIDGIVYNPDKFIELDIHKLIETLEPKKPDFTGNSSSSSDVDTIHSLCKIINQDKYLTPYDPWYKIIFSLKKYALEHKEDEKEIYEIAQKMSMGFNGSIGKYSDEGFENAWSIDNPQVSIGTLHYYAKLSNPKEYKNIIARQNILKYSEDTEFGLFFTKLKGFLYKVVPINKKDHLVYKYNGVYWEEDINSVMLYADIRDTLSGIYGSAFEKMSLKLNKYIKDNQPEEDNDEDDVDESTLSKEQLKERKNEQKERQKKLKEDEKKHKALMKECSDHVKQYDTVYKKLKTSTFIKKIAEDVRSRCLCKNIDEFDTNYRLFAFNNVVYNLQTGKQIEPTPEQHISITTGYDYKEPKTEDIETLNDIISNIFPDKNERELYLNILAYGLIGMPVEKIFCLTGSGSNGKGLLDDLMLSLCGGYGYKGMSSTLTQEQKGGASPELANMNKKRFVIFQEANENAPLQGGIMKELTGGGSICSRTLYSTNTKTVLYNTMVLEFNKRPRFNTSVDNALQRRLCVMNMRSMFVPECDLNKYEGIDNVYPLNKKYKSDEWKNTFNVVLFHILLKRCKKLLTDEIDIDVYINQCPVVLESTQEYVAMGDTLLDFIMSEMVECDDGAVSVKELYKHFKTSLTFVELDKDEKKKWMKEGQFKEAVTRHPKMMKAYKDRLNLTLKQYNKYAKVLKEPNATEDPVGARSVLIGWKIKSSTDTKNPQNMIVELK